MGSAELLSTLTAAVSGNAWMLLPAALALLACATCAACTVACLRRARQAEQRQSQLQADLAVFSEASVRVADTLNALLRGEARGPETAGSSRRRLLAQAQSGMASGESLDGVAARLQLSHDEKRLLGFAALGHRHAAPGVAPSDHGRVGMAVGAPAGAPAAVPLTASAGASPAGAGSAPASSAGPAAAPAAAAGDGGDGRARRRIRSTRNWQA